MWRDRLLVAVISAAILGCGDSDASEASTAGGRSPTSAGTGGQGGAGGGGSGGYPPGGLEACVARWTKACEAMAACDPIAFAADYSDVLDCATKLGRNCAAALYSGVGAIPVEQEQACAEALDVEDCSFLFRFLQGQTEGPPECVSKGPLEEGAACKWEGECQSGICNRPKSIGCGACAAGGGEGDVCSPLNPCKVGLACSRQRCVPLGDTGAPCHAELNPCYADLRCIDGTCAPPLAPGSACDPESYFQECGPRHLCNTMTGVCEPLSVVGEGQRCGLVGGGSAAICEYGTRCLLVDRVEVTGQCVLAGAEGEPCYGNEAYFDAQSACLTGLACRDGVCSSDEGLACQ